MLLGSLIITAIIGLGLIGLITVQMLKASGASVLGIDLNDFVLNKADEIGCDVVVNGKDDKLTEICKSFTNDHGFDKVIVTASSKSAQPVELAGDIARDRDRTPSKIEILGGWSEVDSHLFEVQSF